MPNLTSELINTVLSSWEKFHLRQFICHLRQQEKPYLLRHDILREFAEYGSTAASELPAALKKLIDCTQEIILEPESSCWVVRPQMARQQALRLGDDLKWEFITVQELLDLRDRSVGCYHPETGDLLELDFRPFYNYFPTIRNSRNIGKGLQFLNRYLSSKLFQEEEQWLKYVCQFLSLHSYNGRQLLINELLKNWQELSSQVKAALEFLEAYPAAEPYTNFCWELQAMGFEPGWGNTAARVRESLELLEQLIDSPDAQTLEAFLSRIPTVFRIALVSVHGWFGQEGVLGRPDTGGQVVYVLDQARSLERQLKEDVTLSGLDLLDIQPQIIILTRLIPEAEGTQGNQRLEKVGGTDNTWILRVPFRDENHEIIPHWISRFEIWPYLETYAVDAEAELLAEFGGKPDLIVGNYSDGNLVTFLLARKLKVTSCTIAHALEKSKYLGSNIYWQDLEPQYHFSLQFTADLIAMNAANFIISSTYQEIVGTQDSVGQYESYECFTMPDLYHVVSGIELFSPKFNVVPPGVNESYFFPYSNTEGRLLGERDRLEEFLFTLEDPAQIFGQLDEPNKRPIFSLARLDRIKNLTGLAECFGKSRKLQERCNLILVAGKLRVEDSVDREEASEIEKLYRTIEKYNLSGKIRWLGVMLSKPDTGEIYRIIADRRGIFVQPALFEAFGLTILESMIAGLPTFATKFGGPAEIIQNQINGFLFDPTNLEEAAEIILNFLNNCETNPDYWQQISQAAIARVYSQYTWKIHTSRLLSLARTYRFWNYTQRENQEALMRYLEMLFYLLFKPRAKALSSQPKD